jgi:uncharacterized membrane protein
MSSKRRRDKNKAPAAADVQPRSHTILYTIAAIVALLGLVDATYLTVSHYSGAHVVCGETLDCDKVLASRYSTVAGIPVALLGAIGYFGVFSGATLAAFGYLKPRLPLAILVGLMFLGTLWFLYVQAFLLHAYCRFCLLSAACTFVIAGLLLALPPRRVAD